MPDKYAGFPLLMALPALNVGCETIVSLAKRRQRLAPNGNLRYMSMPKLASMNVLFTWVLQDNDLARELTHDAFRVCLSCQDSLHRACAAWLC